jgi:hypothetical protein
MILIGKLRIASMQGRTEISRKLEKRLLEKMGMIQPEREAT